MKKCGILMHISSLASGGGIGTMGKAAYDWIDFLKASGQDYWQVLPIGHTGFGDSPYQTFSIYAGNPYFIDPAILVEQGILPSNTVITPTKSTKVDYGKLYVARYKLLSQIDISRIDGEKLAQFEDNNRHWLDDYSMFMSLKAHFDGGSWDVWGESIKRRDKDAMDIYSRKLVETISWWKAIQFLFFEQWTALKQYANSQNISIIGDMPIYVAYDSSDVWSNPKLFRLDSRLRMTHIAGVPPDQFSSIGQLWGNPLYNWKAMQASNFDWWVGRINSAAQLFDVVRIDHFRGFAGYFVIDSGATTAAGGHWEKGVGIELFDEIARRTNCNIIAEDLGHLTSDVMELLEHTGFGGMKILQFAIGEPTNPYLPSNYTTDNCVVYTGTHDNQPTRAWYNGLKPAEKRLLNAQISNFGSSEVTYRMIEWAYSSRASTAIIPMQDVLNLGNSARMNTPSTPSGNWQWRIKPNSLTSQLSSRLLQLKMQYIKE